MKSLQKTFLCLTTLLALLIMAAWLRPRVFDEQLVFEPGSVTTDTGINTNLYQQILKTYAPAFDERTWQEVQACLESQDLSQFMLGLACMEKGLQLQKAVPADLRDRLYLRTQLVECLKAEVYRLHQILQRYPDADHLDVARPVQGSQIAAYSAKGLRWVLREFTFQRNTTLNHYWRCVMSFSKDGDMKDLPIERGLKHFGFSNLYGEMLLALAAPHIKSFTEEIDRISI